MSPIIQHHRLSKIALLSLLFWSNGSQLLAAPAEAAKDLSRQLESIRRQQQEQIEQDIEDARKAKQPKPSVIAEPPTETSTVPSVKGGAGCFDIKKIVIKGATQLPSWVHAQLEKTFAGHCLGVNEIEAILGEITRYYLKQGYITTRVYLPSQDLSSGELQLQVVEGKIESISIRDSSSRPPSIINTVPARPGELLNLRDLEQGVEQFNRLMSNNATLDIAPGDEPGTSKVIINNDSGKRWRVAGVYDNSGSESTGQYQAGVNISVDNLFALNDFLIFGHRQALPGERSREYSSSDFVSFILPYGYSTFSFNYSRSDYLSMLALASGNELESRGDTHTTGLSLERVLYRDQDSRISVAGAWTGKDSRNYLGGEYLGVSSRKLSVLDLDINASTFLWGASWSATLGLAKGLDNAGALEDVDGLPEVAPRAQFNKLKYGLNYFLPFAVGERDFTFSAQLTGQHADSVLYGSEQMLIGGTSTVRGFVDNILSGDHGYYLRNELSTHDIINIHDQSLILRTYVGLDYGETRGYANDDQDGYLLGSSIGGGINWSGLNIDLSYDQPLAQSRDLPLESGQFWFRVGATY